MVRMGTYVIVGLLCLAMAMGVFLGGPPPTASDSGGKAAGGPGAPAIVPLPASQQARQARMREVVATLLTDAGGDPATLKTVDGKLAAIQKIIGAGKLKDNPVWELRCLGTVFGDALAQGLDMSWVLVDDGSGRKAALRVNGTDLVASPVELFVEHRDRLQAIDAPGFYATMKTQLAEERTKPTPNAR